MEHEGMDTALAEVIEFLYGGAVDPREFISKMNDMSEVHVPAPLKVKRKKRTRAEREKRQAQIGYASNVVGLTAGGVALVSAAKDPRFKDGGKVARKIYQMGGHLPNISPKKGRAGALVAGGALGLQAANTGGDVVANRVLDREARKNVRKSLDLIIDARREGRITTDQAIDLGASLVEKANWNHPIQATKRLMIHLKTPRATRKQNRAMRSYNASVITADLPRARKVALTTTAVAAGGAGVYTGRKWEQRRNTAQDRYNGMVSSVRKNEEIEKKKVISPKKAKKLLKMAADPKIADNIKGIVGNATDAVKVTPKVAIEHPAAIAVGGTALAGGGIGTGYILRDKNVNGAGVEKSLTWEGEFSKIDTDKRQVFGWCSISEMDGQPVADLQGDYVPIDEVERSAYEYVVKSRKGGDMHARDGEAPLHVGDMIESFVVTPDKLQQMGLPEDSLPKGWWVGFKVNDDRVWELVKKNERTGFSIHGKGRRTEKVVD